MDNSIRIRWAGGEQTFAPGTVVHIGRQPGSEVVLTNANVSRHHSEVEFTDGHWVLRDVGSAQGTWVNGARSPSTVVTGSCSVSLGQPPKGETLELTVAGSEGTRVGTADAGTVLPGATPPPPPLVPQPPPPPPPPAQSPVGAGPAGDIASAGTVIVGQSPDRPGGRLRESAVAGATVVTTDTLNVECNGTSYSFQPGRSITIGRGEDCDIVTANPTVSRHHAQLRHDGKGWLLEDTDSASGTFVNDKRVSSLSLSGSTAAWLGSPDSGERIVLVTSGETRRPSAAKGGGSHRGLLIGAAVAAVVVLVAAVVVLSSRSSSPNRDRLARGTVSIVATNNQGVTVGSGTVIDATKGLILTNAHVVRPTARGLDRQAVDNRTDPDEIELNITPGLDKPAEPKYVGEVVAADGFVDLAVVKITKSIGGRFLEAGDFADLEEIPIGNSDAVKTGDKINVFGFPSAAESGAVTYTSGSISGAVGDDKLKTNRAYFNIDAQILPGNSGGLAANQDGKLIGVPSILRDGKVGSIRPINLALPLIDAARKGVDYQSPYG